MQSRRCPRNGEGGNSRQSKAAKVLYNVPLIQGLGRRAELGHLPPAPSPETSLGQRQIAGGGGGGYGLFASLRAVSPASHQLGHGAWPEGTDMTELCQIEAALDEISEDQAAQAARLGFLQWVMGLPTGASTHCAARAALQARENQPVSNMAVEQFRAYLDQAARLPAVAPKRRSRARVLQ